MHLIPKVLWSMITGLLTQAFIERFTLWFLRNIAKYTKARWDDELVKMVEDHLNGKAK